MMKMEKREKFYNSFYNKLCGEACSWARLSVGAHGVGLDKLKPETKIALDLDRPGDMHLQIYGVWALILC